jgi:hypothetical protein
VVIDQAIRKYGVEEFTISVVCSIDKSDLFIEEELNSLEIHYIAKYHSCVDDPLCNGYNMTFGGENYKRTERVKEMIRKANTGRTMSLESRQKISNAKKGKREPAKLANITKSKNRYNKDIIMFDKIKHLNRYSIGWTKEAAKILDATTARIFSLCDRLKVSYTLYRSSDWWNHNKDLILPYDKTKRGGINHAAKETGLATSTIRATCRHFNINILSRNEMCKLRFEAEWLKIKDFDKTKHGWLRKASKETGLTESRISQICMEKEAQFRTKKESHSATPEEIADRVDLLKKYDFNKRGEISMAMKDYNLSKGQVIRARNMIWKEQKGAINDV